MSKLIDIAGKEFGYLTVVKQHGRDSNCNLKWECLCVCGSITIVYGDNLIRRGNNQSCGCMKGALITKKKTRHGATCDIKNNPEYNTWNNMKTRCYNFNNKSAVYYKDKGVTVCDRWLNSFEDFLIDMGRRPSSKHSIDRIDVNGNYEPSNCKWSTLSEQANNKTNNVWIEYNGLKLTIYNWAKLFKVTNNAIKYHLKKGKSFDYIYKNFMTK